MAEKAKKIDYKKLLKHLYQPSTEPVIVDVPKMNYIMMDGTIQAGEGVEGLETLRLAPEPSGALPVADGHFDLATCFGVLHHVPNVSAVVAELARCLRPGEKAEPLIPVP